MTEEDKIELRKNWRGRRLLACRLHDDLNALIDALADDDLSNGAAPVLAPDAGTRQSMKNLSTVLLHIILRSNDGYEAKKFQSF